MGVLQLHGRLTLVPKDAEASCEQESASEEEAPVVHLYAQEQEKIPDGIKER
jgi:hypothetical protein